jgi:hypothetical protein
MPLIGSLSTANFSEPTNDSVSHPVRAEQFGSKVKSFCPATTISHHHGITKQHDPKAFAIGS